MLQALLEQPLPAPLGDRGWLFHHHSQTLLSKEERQLLVRSGEAATCLVHLKGEVESAEMASCLSRCPLAMLAHEPQRYRQRSSGMLLHWGLNPVRFDLGRLG